VSLRLTQIISGYWTVEGADLELWRATRGWRVASTEQPTRLWLEEHDLTEARFPRRKDLLRTLEALLDLGAPPLTGAQPVKLLRVGRRAYATCDRRFHVERVDPPISGCKWRVVDPSGGSEITRTLRSAARLIGASHAESSATLTGG